MVPVVSSIRKDADLSNMKFLVLALCVCAASAASFGAYKPWQPQQQVAKAVAQVVATPNYAVPTPVFAAKTYAPKVVEPVVSIVPASKNVVPVKPVVAKTAYTGKADESGILRSESEVNADGFNYFFETTNGIAAQSSGVLRKVDNSEVLTVQGSYQYVAPDGTPVQFSYVADENGYQPRSNLLPEAPPVPEAILRSLEYIRTHPQKPENY